MLNISTARYITIKEWKELFVHLLLRVGHFTTAAGDNIDHNPSSSSAHDCFHGTAISLFQHPDSSVIEVRVVIFAMADDMNTKGAIACLPETYTDIPPATLVRQDPPVPKQEGPNKTVHQIISQAMEREYRYVYCVHDKGVK